MKRFFILLFLIFCVTSLWAEDSITELTGLYPKTAICKEHTPYVYMSMIINTGIGSEADYNMGMATFISKLLLQKTRHTSADEVERIFYSSGCSLSLSVNLDYIEIKTITLKKDFFRAINIIGECLTEPKVTNEDIEKAKAESIDQMTETYDSSFQRMYDTLRQNIYTGNPYKRQLYGTVQSIKSINKSMIAQYYKENFSLYDITVAVAGDVTEDFVTDCVEKAFVQGYRTKKRNPFEYEDRLKENKTVEIKNYDKDENITYYYCGYLFPGAKDKDYYACLLLSEILGSGKSSLVFRNIRQKYGIGYMIGFKYETLKRQSHAYLYMSCINSSDRLEIAKEEYRNIVDTIKAQGVPEDDLEKSKMYIKEQRNIENLDLLKKAHNICVSEAVFGTADAYTQFDRKIDSITNKDIKEAAVKYMKNYCEIISRPFSE